MTNSSQAPSESSRPDDVESLRRSATLPSCIPWTPTPHQLAFLLAPELEVFYGGAAGGAKTVALLMAAAQYAEVPGYSALLLRRTFPDLNQPKALIPLSRQWWQGSAATFSAKDHEWRFPSGATIRFGYCESTNDVYQYQGAAFQFIGIDELTQWTEWEYQYLFSRLRRETESRVPLRMRSTANPGGRGHQWVKRRFLDERDPDRAFMPAMLSDNPHLDHATYTKSLSNLDPVTRRRLLEGNWEVTEEGAVFRREWLPLTDELVPTSCPRVRWWDMAATAGSGCRTAGALLARTHAGRYVIEDVVKGQWAPGDRDRIMRDTAVRDGPSVVVAWEEEGGSAGKTVTTYLKRMFVGRATHASHPTGPKESRWGVLASAAEQGLVSVSRGPFAADFVDECCAANVDGDGFLDQVDAASDCFIYLSSGALRRAGDPVAVSNRNAPPPRETDSWLPASPF